MDSVPSAGPGAVVCWEVDMHPTKQSFGYQVIVFEKYCLLPWKALSYSIITEAIYLDLVSIHGVTLKMIWNWSPLLSS